MDEQFIRSYFILDLKPGASWDELRDTYRSLVKAWHPDRFQLDNERQLAEEKTKEITRAYKTLADYYRKHGNTPVYPHDHSSDAGKSTTFEAPDDRPEDIIDNIDFSAGKNAHHTANNTPRHTSSWKTLSAVVTAVLLGYLWLLDRSPDTASIPDALSDSPTLGAPEVSPNGNPALQTTTQFFTFGTRIGEVYSIQGIPSKTEDGIWHYGKSRIYFIDGRVTRWDSHQDDPLKASYEAGTAVQRNENFTRGSTKAEVIAAQGQPWHQTEHEWSYGSSRIFFSDGLVTSWEESPAFPLKARK